MKLSFFAVSSGSMDFPFPKYLKKLRFHAILQIRPGNLHAFPNIFISAIIPNGEFNGNQTGTDMDRQRKACRS